MVILQFGVNISELIAIFKNDVFCDFDMYLFHFLPHVSYMWKAKTNVLRSTDFGQVGPLTYCVQM